MYCMYCSCERCKELHGVFVSNYEIMNDGTVLHKSSIELFDTIVERLENNNEKTNNDTD